MVKNGVFLFPVPKSSCVSENRLQPLFSPKERSRLLDSPNPLSEAGIPGNSGNLHILSRPQSCHGAPAKLLSLASRFKLIYVCATELRIHLGDTRLCSGNPPMEIKAAPSFPEGEVLLFLLLSHLSCCKPVNLKLDTLRKRRLRPLWIQSIFKCALRAWPLYRCWRNEI